MKFSNCLKLAMVVGLAASAASAGDRVVTQLPATGGITPQIRGVIDFSTGTISQYGTRSNTSSAYDNVEAAVDGTDGVYDVTLGLGNPADFYFYSLLGGGAADNITLDRRFGGRGIFGDQVLGTLSTMSWGTVYAGDGANPTVDQDDYHIFWNDLIEWDTVGDLLRGSFIGGFYFENLPVSDLNNTGFFDIWSATGLDTAGVVFNDNYIVYQHISSSTGSAGTPVPDAAAGQIFNGDGTAGNGAQYAGWSGDLFLYDADASGTYNANEWLYYFGGGNFVSNILLNLGVQACDADFDGSGFVDLDDFNSFVPAYEAGC